MHSLAVLESKVRHEGGAGLEALGMNLFQVSLLASGGGRLSSTCSHIPPSLPRLHMAFSLVSAPHPSDSLLQGSL